MMLYLKHVIIDDKYPSGKIIKKNDTHTFFKLDANGDVYKVLANQITANNDCNETTLNLLSENPADFLATHPTSSYLVAATNQMVKLPSGITATYAIPDNNQKVFYKLSFDEHYGLPIINLLLDSSNFKSNVKTAIGKPVHNTYGIPSVNEIVLTFSNLNSISYDKFKIWLEQTLLDIDAKRNFEIISTNSIGEVLSKVNIFGAYPLSISQTHTNDVEVDFKLDYYNELLM